MKETKFKQTEVGLIPSDWEVKRLSSLGSFSKGKSISRTESNTGKIPAVRYGELYTVHNDYIKTFYSHISEEIAQKATLLKTGDLLFTCSGETKEDIGKCVAYIGNGKAYAGSDLIILTPNKKISSLFYGFLLNTDMAVKQKASMAQGDAVVHISSESIGKVFIPIPTLEEQKRIAQALSDVDAVITTTEKIIAKKKALKQGAMQTLLSGKMRIQNGKWIKTTNFKQTELGPIPQEWEVTKIGEFTKVQAGGTPSTSIEEYWNGNIRWMNSGELNLKRVYDVEGRITELGLNNSSTHLIPRYCVLIGLAGQGKTRGTAAINYVELCTNQSIAAIFPSPKHNSEYLYQNIDNRYSELRELSDGGGGRGGLNLRILNNFDIALPPINEQTAIATVLSDMDSEIAALETKLAKYRQLKTGMMQQLLTGKIRLV